MYKHFDIGHPCHITHIESLCDHNDFKKKYLSYTRYITNHQLEKMWTGMGFSDSLNISQCARWVVCPGRGTRVAWAYGLFHGFRYFCEIEGKPWNVQKMCFFQVFLRTPLLQPARNLVQRWRLCNASALRVNSIHSNTNWKKVSKTVAERSERIAFGSRDSELAAKVQARFTARDRSRPIQVFWLCHHCGLQN